MTPRQAIEFIRKHGIVLASARGPVPRLAEAIAGGPIKGSWWAHPKGQEIFHVLRSLDDVPDVLACRLVDGKITLVHRRLWPALVRAAPRFSPRQLAATREEHTKSGHHVTREIPFPKWVLDDVARQAEKLDEKQALAALGPWAVGAGRAKRRATARPR